MGISLPFFLLKNPLYPAIIPSTVFSNYLSATCNYIIITFKRNGIIVSFHVILKFSNGL